MSIFIYLILYLGSEGHILYLNSGLSTRLLLVPYQIDSLLHICSRVPRCLVLAIVTFRPRMSQSLSCASAVHLFMWLWKFIQVC